MFRSYHPMGIKSSSASRGNSRRLRRAGQLESLERRELMFSPQIVGGNVFPRAPVTLDSSTHVLTIEGTSYGDTASAYDAGNELEVVLNGSSYRFLRRGTTSCRPTMCFYGDLISKIVFYGYGGNDDYRNETDVPTIAYGHEGMDTLQGGWGQDQLLGGADGDTLSGAPSRLATQSDQLEGGPGNDTLLGSAGSDWLYGQSGIDTIRGGDGTDWLYGEDDRDYLYGEQGIDYLIGGYGDNFLYGGDGDDWLYGFTGNDVMYGDQGADKLFGYLGQDTLYGGWGNDELHGGGGHDRIYGEANWDSLWGDGGNDDLYGGPGQDVLDGGAGFDGLFGGGDLDVLTGGDGSDRFLNRTSAADTISDFDRFDARITFTNGTALTGLQFAGQTGTYNYSGGLWRDSEIETIDSALAVLHRATGNKRLLETSDGVALNFTRYGVLTASNGGSFSAGAWNSEDGTINLPSVAFTTQDTTRNTVFHEVGHNWDTEYRASAWQALSGWTQANKSADPQFVMGSDRNVSWWHLRSASFVRSTSTNPNYAKTNPEEDFASSFGNYFYNRGAFTTTFYTIDISTIPGKNTFLDGLVASLS